MIKRKKKWNNNPEVKSSVIDINDGYLDDDPQRNEILKVWESDASDTEEESRPSRDEMQYRERFQRRSQALTTGSYYVIILIVIGVFIYACNIYNMRQLERIKEEYGMDTKPHAPEVWWKKALMYNIIVRSFKDSDGDGVGDLKGVLAHSEHLLYLGVDAVILSRILESPFDDFGKDVSNFTRVDPVYGTLQDFRDIVEELHERGIKVLLELNPNHSHRKHQYFELSRSYHRDYRDHYVWSSGRVLENTTRVPPNNWVSLYGGSAWTWDPVRNQYYYHYYSSEMPDFNFNNPKVIRELQSVFSYWFKQGIDGIYLEGAHVFYEVDDLTLDEPLSEKPGVEQGDYASVDHVYTEDHADIHDLMTTMREWVDMAASIHDRKVAFLVNIEDSQLGDIMKYYQTGAHAPISHHLRQITETSGGREIWDIVDSYRMNLPESQDAIWMLSHPDKSLLALNKGLLYQNALNMLMLLLPGGALTYMGEELALGVLSTAQVHHMYKDSRSQNCASMLSPMSWDDSHNAGFSKVPPWLPLREGHQGWNVQSQKSDQRNTAPIHLYGKLARLRKETSFIDGDTQYSLVNDQVFSFMRFAKNSAPYLVVVNVGVGESTDDHVLTAGVQWGKVVAYCKPVGPGVRARYVEGRTIDLQKVSLMPGEGLVLLLLMDIVMDGVL